jgi:hypothetical protein
MLKCGRSICTALRAAAVLGSAVMAINILNTANTPEVLDSELKGFIGFS